MYSSLVNKPLTSTPLLVVKKTLNRFRLQKTGFPNYETNRILAQTMSMATKNTKPTESELEILGVLWKKETASVREVHEELAKSKEVGYTTTLKLMQIMHEKGLVKRDNSSKVHYYEAALSQQTAQKKLLNKMIDGLFGGSATNLVLQALGNYKASNEELEEIQTLLNDMKLNGKDTK